MADSLWHIAARTIRYKPYAISLQRGDMSATKHRGFFQQPAALNILRLGDMLRVSAAFVKALMLVTHSQHTLVSHR